MTSDERFVASVMDAIRENPGLNDQQLANVLRLRPVTIAEIRKRVEQGSSDHVKAA